MSSTGCVLKLAMSTDIAALLARSALILTYFTICTRGLLGGTTIFDTVGTCSTCSTGLVGAAAHSFELAYCAVVTLTLTGIGGSRSEFSGTATVERRWLRRTFSTP